MFAQLSFFYFKFNIKRRVIDPSLSLMDSCLCRNDRCAYAFNLTGPAFFTSSVVPSEKSLKFSTNLAASASYFFQYSSLFPQLFDGSSTSSGTSGQERGTSNPNNLSFLYFILSSFR